MPEPVDDEFGRIRRASAVELHADGSATLTVADLPVSCVRCGGENFVEDTFSVWTPFDPPVPGRGGLPDKAGVWTGGVCGGCLLDGDQVQDLGGGR